jgi:hypothetical protein
MSWLAISRQDMLLIGAVAVIFTAAKGTTVNEHAQVAHVLLLPCNNKSYFSGLYRNWTQPKEDNERAWLQDTAAKPDDHPALNLHLLDDPALLQLFEKAASVAKTISSKQLPTEKVRFDAGRCKRLMSNL